MTFNKHLVLVEWNDAWADTDGFATLHGVQQTHHPMLVQTLGWLLQDDETGISLVNEQSTADGQQTYRGRTFIPRAMVVDVHLFKLTKQRLPKPPEEPVL